jgi:hypothetical protein
MAVHPNRRLTPAELEADRVTLIGAKELQTYTPLNQAYSVDAVSQLQAVMEQAQHEETRQTKALTISRDAAVAAEWARHDAILGIKTQAIAQYGADSDAIHTLGLKKKSERQRPTRRKPKAAT